MSTCSWTRPSQGRVRGASRPCRGERTAAREAERDGQVRLWWEQTPVDLFFSVLPFHQQVAAEVRHVSFEGRTIPVVGCTGLTVFKAMFDRPRDWVDIEAMVEARAFDLEEARRWVVEMVGEDARAEKLSVLSS